MTAVDGPPCSPDWLEVHHRAKLHLRRSFAQAFSEFARPTRLVDLGCSTGVWLDLFDQILPTECEFIGVDIDEAALELAEKRSQKWSRRTVFQLGDLDDPNTLPDGDAVTLFNTFHYVNDADQLLHRYASDDQTSVAIRQFDGDLLRFGPIPSRERNIIEDAQREGILLAEPDSYYELDRLYAAVRGSAFTDVVQDFEAYHQGAPFTADEEAYLGRWLDWMSTFLTVDAHNMLDSWRRSPRFDIAYLIEVDYTAMLRFSPCP